MILVITASITLTACDQDPFGLSYREIANGIYLQRWEDGKTFYLQTKETLGSNGSGFLDGTVQNIGWNKNLILVEKHSSFRGDPSGWYVISISTKKIKGPLSEKEIKQIPETKEIELVTAHTAWEKLD
jgi:hypothetical protein